MREGNVTRRRYENPPWQGSTDIERPWPLSSANPTSLEYESELLRMTSCQSTTMVTHLHDIDVTAIARCFEKEGREHNDLRIVIRGTAHVRDSREIPSFAPRRDCRKVLYLRST